MKNRILIIVLSLILLLPAVSFATENLLEEKELSVAEAVEENKLEDTNSEQFKQPISKRKIVKKFLLAMGGVAVSSFGLFFILTLYNNIRERSLNKNFIDNDDESLETPTDLNEAVKMFLNKTNWKI